MRIGRASLVAALVAAVALSVAGTASSAGAVRVSGSIVDVVLVCDGFVLKGMVFSQDCTGTETWVGDISGDATFTFNFSLNLVSGVLTGTGSETITDACVLDTCGGSLFVKFQITIKTDPGNNFAMISSRSEDSFHGGTGPFANAHGSILASSLGNDPQTYTDGRIGL